MAESAGFAAVLANETESACLIVFTSLLLLIRPVPSACFVARSCGSLCAFLPWEHATPDWKSRQTSAVDPVITSQTFLWTSSIDLTLSTEQISA